MELITVREYCTEIALLAVGKIEYGGLRDETDVKIQRQYFCIMPLGVAPPSSLYGVRIYILYCRARISPPPPPVEFV